MAEPTVCVKALRAPFFMAAIATGVPVPELTTRFGVPATLLADLAARVPHARVMRLWDGLAELAGDESFGLTAATVLGAPQLDLVDVAAQRSPSVRALTESFGRYQRLFHDANDVRILEEGEVTIVRHRFSSDLRRSRHFMEFVLATWVARLRALVGPGRMELRGVTFRHARPAGGGPYEAALGAPVQFGAADDALILPRALLDQPVAGADPAAARALEAHLDRELLQLGSAPFPDQVRSLVVGLLGAGSSLSGDIGHLARQLGVSRRTLQRRLADAGTSFRAVTDLARREVALAEMAKGTATTTDLAFLLGFSEHSAFARAFRRWTGQSPARYARGLG
jgi:AraC-like DNA-binding protein